MAFSLDLCAVILSWRPPWTVDRSKKLSLICHDFGQCLRSDVPWQSVFGFCWTRKMLSHWSGMQAWSLHTDPSIRRNIRVDFHPCLSQGFHSPFTRLYDDNQVHIHFLPSFKDPFFIDAGLLFISTDHTTVKLPILYLWHLLFHGPRNAKDTVSFFNTFISYHPEVRAHVTLKRICSNFELSTLNVTMKILMEWKSHTPHSQSFSVQLINQPGTRTSLLLRKRQRQIELPLFISTDNNRQLVAPLWGEESDQLIWDRSISEHAIFSLFRDLDPPESVKIEELALTSSKGNTHHFVFQLTRGPISCSLKSIVRLMVVRQQTEEAKKGTDKFYFSFFVGMKILTPSSYLVEVEKCHDQGWISRICPMWLTSKLLIVWIFNRQLQLCATALLSLPPSGESFEMQ